MARKLAAIVAADVVGYSRLMGDDEAKTLPALKTHRRELIDPKIAEHQGRIVKTTIEFPSLVEAVQCAVEVQSAMEAASNAMAGRPEEAHKAVARLQQLNQSLRVSNLRSLLGPYRRDEYISQYEEGLRRAGLPE